MKNFKFQEIESVEVPLVWWKWIILAPMACSIVAGCIIAAIIV